MQCKELETVLADDALSALSREAREHLAGCGACRDLLADLSAIVNAAKHIPAEINPPERVWVALRAQLEAERILREPAVVAAAESSRSAGWQAFFRPRILGTVAATLLVAAGSIYLVKRPGSGIENTSQIVNTAKTSTAEPPKPVEVVTASAAPVSPAAARPQLGGRHMVASAAAEPRESTRDLAPSPSERAYFGNSAAVLTETEGAVPSRVVLADNAAVDASLRDNLRILNEFIAECEARLKKNPKDRLTREYLNMAYQQKAELLSAMMDNGRSEN